MVVKYKDYSLVMTERLTELVNADWESGEFLSKTTDITKILLKYWFDEDYCYCRNYNFHKGQKQAILNIIYCVEVLKIKDYTELYKTSFYSPDESFLNLLEKENKYCVKIATGTGKTWVMLALFVWQYLNNYTKNFLVIAPGLIVYDRILDAFLGKEKNGYRNFETSTLKKFKDLFLPEEYRDNVLNFIQNSCIKKEEICNNCKSEGIIVITNWHKLNKEEAEEIEEEVEDFEGKIKKSINELFPFKKIGVDLNDLDGSRMNELEELKKFKDFCIFNDEAHHIHGEDIIWKKIIKEITDGKNYIQFDFSATPFETVGVEEKKVNHYFPHIVANFELKEAIEMSIVKSIVIDQRENYANLPSLDFRAIKEENKTISLSDGQKIMIMAGLTKLKKLETDFAKIDENKNPKMLIVCEDTTVVPFVEEYLENNGLGAEDILTIDSNKKGEVGDKEWARIKEDLFNIDSKKTPKIIISIMMLREGFDVNNICVIVPLRSSESSILLEQTIGRGLRLMWTDNDIFNEARKENIKLIKKKETPSSFIDVLNIIEHPKFIKFYEGLGIDVGVMDEEEENKTKTVGDNVKSVLKENYKDYDICYPDVVQESEEVIDFNNIDYRELKPFEGYSLSQLEYIVDNKKTESFHSQTIIIGKVEFGSYEVNADSFSANGYNEFLIKIAKIITQNIIKINEDRRKKIFPVLQFNENVIISVLDKYIRNGLFDQEFDPIENWKILMLAEYGITKHIVKEMSFYLMKIQQNNLKKYPAIIEKRYFSELKEFVVKENYSVDILKTIYTKTPYSIKSKFEKDFLIKADEDGDVLSVIKIRERSYNFLNFKYIKENGMIGYYYPDFVVKFKNDIFFVETKAEVNICNKDVINKGKAIIENIKKINSLEPEERDNFLWHYSIIGDEYFYAVAYNTRIRDMLETCETNKEYVVSYEGYLL